jgi:hypothetical protein
MAVRAVPGVRPGGTGEEPQATLQGAAATDRGACCRPSPPQAAPSPRFATSSQEILGDVPAVPLDSSGPDVPAWCIEVSGNRRCTAPDSHRGAKRGLVLGASLLSDAHSGGIHHARSGLGKLAPAFRYGLPPSSRLRRHLRAQLTGGHPCDAAVSPDDNWYVVQLVLPYRVLGSQPQSFVDSATVRKDLPYATSLPSFHGLPLPGYAARDQRHSL